MILDTLARVFNSETIDFGTSRDPALKGIFSRGFDSEAGINVTHEKALGIPEVWQAVSIISGDAASLPFNVYRRLRDDREQKKSQNRMGGRHVDTTHPADKLVSMQPNDEISAFEYRRRIYSHALLWGNGYGFIDIDENTNMPRALVNLLPNKTTAVRVDPNDEGADRLIKLMGGTLFYVTEVDGVNVPLRKNEVFHLRGLTITSNEVAEDLVRKAKDAFGVSLASQGYTSKFFDNGARIGGILRIPPGYTKEAADNLEEGWRTRYSSSEGWFKTAILRDGAEFHKVGTNPQEADLSNLNQDQKRAVASYFNIPPFKLGIEDAQSKEDTEQAQLAYLTGTLRHWLMAEKSEAEVKLLTIPQKNRRTHFFDHDTDKIIELDALTRERIHEIRRKNLVETGNEWRIAVGKNPIDDPLADKLLNPNTLPKLLKEEAGGDDEEEQGDTDTDSDDDEEDSFDEPTRNLLRSSLERVSTRLAKDACRLSKDGKKFSDWIDSGFGKHRKLFGEMMDPTIEMVASVQSRDKLELRRTIEDSFFGYWDDALSKLLESPYSAASLQKNVEEASPQLEDSIPETVTNEILERETNAS